MKRHPMLAFCCAVLLTAASPKESAAKEDQEKLQGEWNVLEIVDDGYSVPRAELKDDKVAIAGDILLATVPNHTTDMKCRFNLNPAKSPKFIDMTVLEGDHKGSVVHGIYRLEGDLLKFCFGKFDDSKRPTGFSAEAGSDFTLHVYHRAKRREAAKQK